MDRECKVIMQVAGPAPPDDAIVRVIGRIFRREREKHPALLHARDDEVHRVPVLTFHTAFFGESRCTYAQVFVPKRGNRRPLLRDNHRYQGLLRDNVRRRRQHHDQRTSGRNHGRGESDDTIGNAQHARCELPGATIRPQDAPSSSTRHKHVWPVTARQKFPFHYFQPLAPNASRVHPAPPIQSRWR